MMRSWYDYPRPVGPGLGYSLMPDTWWWDPDCPENTVRYCVATGFQSDRDWAQRMGCMRSVQDAGCTTASPGSNPGNVYCCPRQTLQPYPGVETREQAEETQHPPHGADVGLVEERERQAVATNTQLVIMMLLPLGALALFGAGAWWYLKSRREREEVV